MKSSIGRAGGVNGGEHESEPGRRGGGRLDGPPQPGVAEVGVEAGEVAACVEQPQLAPLLAAAIDAPVARAHRDPHRPCEVWIEHL
ncbi:hypothetical protein [Nonomuraea typhae]|uniref:hypothetical protein n=1 Tax=Nonomuraea typhae TaxID=2603600 RepID=UPI0012F99F08|nr:hypothetical protein [Nonomuraea typhae]